MKKSRYIVIVLFLSAPCALSGQGLDSMDIVQRTKETNMYIDNAVRDGIIDRSVADSLHMYIMDNDGFRHGLMGLDKITSRLDRMYETLPLTDEYVDPEERRRAVERMALDRLSVSVSNNLKPQELPPAVKFITLLASVIFRNDRGYYGDEKRVMGGLFYIKMPGGAPPPESEKEQPR